MAAAEQLNYVPNAAARSLMTKRTNLIAVVVSNQATVAYDRFLDHFNQKLSEIGYNVFLITAVEAMDKDDRLLQLLRYPVDGFVVTAAASLEFSRQVCRHCMSLGIPAVTLNRIIGGIELGSINCDHKGGGAIAADVLIESGLTRLAGIVGHEPTTVNIERMRGFVDRATERGLSEPIIVQSRQFSFEGGYTSAAKLMSTEPEIEGLFCVNDQMAIGAMEMVRTELGLRIPEDLSVIGFDDMPAAAWPSFDLTTIRQPIEEMVEETIRILMDAIDNDRVATGNAKVPVELVSRGSTRRPEAMHPLDRHC